MTGGEFSVLFGAVFLLTSALLCVVYGIVAGAREAVLSRKEKEQEDPGSSGNDDLCHALYQKGKGAGSSGLRGIGLDPDSA